MRDGFLMPSVSYADTYDQKNKNTEDLILCNKA